MALQQSGTNTRTTTSIDQAPPSAAELREQIRRNVEEATAAARAGGGQGGGFGGGFGRDRDVRITTPGGGITIQRGYERNEIPPQVVDISIGFFVMCAVIVIGWPLARAFGKRIERRAAEPAAIDPHTADQLKRIEQAVDAMSVEIERISESQRYIAKLHSRQPAGAAVAASSAGASPSQRGPV